ncbi:MAG: hypothetical protein AAGE84_31955 [Cyanobacteria bacterium P01_G01_bin.39]
MNQKLNQGIDQIAITQGERTNSISRIKYKTYLFMQEVYSAVKN